MKLRRRFMRQVVGAVALPVVVRAARAQAPTQPRSLEAAPIPIAEQLAAYVDGFRYEDLDTKTIERVKSHVIDTLGCGIAAFDELPVHVCRDVALAAGNGRSTVIGTKRRTTPDLATFAWQASPSPRKSAISIALPPSKS